MRTRRILTIVLVMVLLVLASVVTIAVTPAAAISGVYEEKILCDADENNELTKEELGNAILPYMLGEGDFKLDDIGDAAYVYAYWGGELKTVIDEKNREVTFYRPIERVVTTSKDLNRVIMALNALNKLVGRATPCGCEIEEWVSEPKRREIGGGMFHKIPMVGKSPNEEFIASIEPDVIFVSSGNANAMQEKLGVPVVYANPRGSDFKKAYESIERIGKVLGDEKESEELISFIEEKIDKVREVTSQIPENEKPRVYLSTRTGGPRGGLTRTFAYYEPLNVAGGVNVAKGPGTSVTVSKEQIIAWNPDIFLLAGMSYIRKTPYQDVFIETVLEDPDFQTLNAVKNESVYYHIFPYCCGTPLHRNLADTMYIAKVIHPDKFKDLDVEKEGNEIYERLLGVDGLFSEYADTIGWLREGLDEQQKS